MQKGTRIIETRKCRIANKYQSKDKIITCTHARKKCFGENPHNPQTKIIKGAPGILMPNSSIMRGKDIKTHYEKLCLSRPHYPTIKTKKTTHIQLLCNYPLGITTTV
jgi:hypothetical protein